MEPNRFLPDLVAFSKESEARLASRSHFFVENEKSKQLLHTDKNVSFSKINSFL